MSTGESAGADAPDGLAAEGGFGAGAADSATPPTPPADAAPGGAAGTPTEPAATAPGGAPSAPQGDAAGAAGTSDGQPGSISVEDLVVDLERVSTERDEYLDSLRRLQAEFENYRKAVAKRESDARARANNALVAELLPVLDACDGAVANGAEDVAPVRTALIDALVKQGLERIEPTDAPFDPEQHEAVMHEPGDGDGGPVVAEVLRVGYGWKGNVVRPAMVRVVG